MRPTLLRGILALCAVLVLSAMGWATSAVLRGARSAAEAQANVLTQTRLQGMVLRMDSAMGLFLQLEQSRPPQHYRAFSPGAFGRRVPSPLLLREEPLVRLRFDRVAGGPLTSPEVPDAELIGLARSLVDPSRVRVAKGRLEELQRMLPEGRLREVMKAAGSLVVTREEMDRLRSGVKTARGIDAPYQTNVSNLVAFWLDQQLILVRQVWEGPTERFQGCWMDWDVVEELLRSELPEDAPRVRLEPLDPGRVWDGVRLSTLPLGLRLEAAPAAQNPSPVLVWALALAWGTLLLALGGGVVLVETALRFGERRAAFLSTVTHELRTPLTTFKLYAELLSEGMVQDEVERGALLATLRSEAERLDHLVRNVLSFSRMEARRGVQLERMEVAALLDRIEPRLRQRCEFSGRSLELLLPGDAHAVTLRLDPALTEQILFNLVDNACKHAVPASDPTIHLEVEADLTWVKVRVRDHGPGVPRALRGDLWRPFHRSGPAHGERIPGVGLGLALCRRLALRQRGELTVQWGAGASFTLTLPRA